MNKAKQKEKIDREVQKTLECFDQVEQIEAGPSFFSRIQGKLRENEEKPGFQFAPPLKFGFLRTTFLLFIITVNLVLAILVLQKGKSQPENRTEYISVIASYYDLKSDSMDSLFSSEKR